MDCCNSGPAEERNMNRAFRDVIRWKSSIAPLQRSPKTASASEIRKTFLDYFCEENGHMYIRSSPVFSLKDPTLAFTNAGMNQFKEVFLGIVQPASSRIANSQKCIRIGGLHNDLSQVGEDGTHHTFFEMLGNWSFGDYFKEESCRMSWNLLTEVFNIPSERLYVTYFKGDRTLGLEPDFEVKEIWRKIGVKESHILAFGSEENFWTGSLTGPCGPCTEIHYNHCAETNEAGSLVNAGTNAVTELWNLVFTQYNRKPDGELTKLNTHFVDTGMGFERLVAVLQGKLYNYDTDLFLPLFEVIKNHTGHSGYTGKYDGNAIDNSYRVLADHSRMIAVALGDGMLPNHQNKVRGIIKRTFTVIEKIFNAKIDLLKELTVHVAQSLSDVYPEIEKNLPKIHYIIEEEAETIKSRQEKAVKRWEKLKKSYPKLQNLNVRDLPQVIEGLDYIGKNILNQKQALSSEDIFILFDTYGIPVVKVKEIALQLDLQCDLDAYKEYEIIKKKTVKEFAHKKFISGFNEYPYFDVLTKLEEKKVQPTFDYFKYDYRVDGTGKYIFKDQPTTIEAILLDNNLVDEISFEDIQEGKEIGIILDRTQLFSEEGGQASDFGTLEIENKIVFNIDKPVKVKNFVLHFGRFKNFPRNSKVAVQNIGIVKLNEDRRRNIMQNHTALHLLNAALRQELYVVSEKFSNVTPEKLHLNFMVYKSSLSEIEGIKKIEKYVNDFILHGVSVKRKIYNHEQFQALNDVVFTPGETILEREIPVIEVNSGFKLTREYCTGTHVLNTSDLKDFVITKYVKGSFRRPIVEAVTGEKCLRIRKADSELKEKWSGLQKEISECSLRAPFEVDDLLSRLKKLSLEASESTEISHLTGFEIKAAVREAQTELNELIKTSLRLPSVTLPKEKPGSSKSKLLGDVGCYQDPASSLLSLNFFAEEIKKASASASEKFIVHVLDYYGDFDPADLESAASVCEDKPLFIFFRLSKDLLAAQCIVPQAFISEKFSAQLWLTDSMISLSIEASWKKHQNPKLMYFTSQMKITESQLRQIMNKAIELAKMNTER